MQHGAADDGVHALVVPRKVIELADLEVPGRKPRRKGRGKPLHARDRCALPVEAETREAVAQKIDQIASIACAGVHHSAAAVEAPLQNLIEEIDVDLAELRSEVGAGSRLGDHTLGVLSSLAA